MVRICLGCFSVGWSSGASVKKQKKTLKNANHSQTFGTDKGS